MTNTTLSGTEIAKLTAAMTGGGFKRANSRDAAVTRFYNVASDRKISVADACSVLEAGDFAAAQAALSALMTPAKEAAPARPKKATNVAKPAAKVERSAGKRAATEADAKAGKMPSAPDFSADTHKPYRKKLAEVVALVETKDLKALKAMKIPTYSSSPKAIARYRDLAVIAIEAAA